MNLKNFVEGLMLIQKHYTDPCGYHIGCERDQFYMYQTDVLINGADVARLIEMGWFQPEQKTDTYDPENGWSAFT